MIRRFPVLLATMSFAAASSAQVGQAIGLTPTTRGPDVAFLANQGQWHPAVLHAASFGAMHVFLERAAITIDVQQIDSSVGDLALGLAPEPTSRHGAVVRLAFGRSAAVVPGARLPGRTTFMLGDDRSRWHSDVPAHSSIRYDQIAPGIALDAYARDGHFEYALLVAAGADLTAATINVAGADAVTKRADGTLAIETAYGPIVQSAPVAFVGDRRLACHFELRGPRAFGFVVPDWNGQEPLLVDPGLTWGSYLGGSASDGLSAVAVGDDGVVTLAGGASSMDFPATIGAYQSLPVNADCLVVRLDPSLPPAAQIVSSTWYGGSGTDTFTAVEVDAQGVATLFGSTRSPDLPVSAIAFQTTFAAGTNDALIARLDLQQTGAQQLVYATYLGGSGNEIVQGPCRNVVVDQGIITVTGSTLSSDFPTTANAWRTTRAGGSGTDGFLARLDPSLPASSQLVYATYFGGTSGDGGSSLGIDASGRVAIAGTTSSADFPVTANAFDGSLGGPGDAALMLFDVTKPPAQQLVYSSYFGGSLGEGAPAFGLDADGAFCFGGNCLSPDLPVTANAFDPVFSAQDAYLARLDPALPAANQLTYCSYLGGSAAESATALVVGATGVITMTGGTTSTDFPVTDGTFQATNHGGFQDTWLVRIDPSRPPAQQLLYSTYLGGDGLETLFGLALDAIGGVWCVGFTQSTDFPTTPNGYDGSPNGANDAFLAHLDMMPIGVTPFGAATSGCAGLPVAGVTAMPRVGNPHFVLTCTGVTTPSFGVLALSTQPAIFPLSVLGVDVWVDVSSLATLALSTTSPQVDFPLPLPPNPTLAGVSLAVQFVWFANGVGPSCPAIGWSASNALLFVVQP